MSLDDLIDELTRMRAMYPGGTNVVVDDGAKASIIDIHFDASPGGSLPSISINTIIYPSPTPEPWKVKDPY